MSISVIIPTLNEADGITHLLKDVQERSSGLVSEIIVADGGSRDNTPELAREAGADVITCRRRGRAAQMNEGAGAAKGDVLYFLHADTTPPEGFDWLIQRAISNGADSGCFQLRFSSSHPALRFFGWCTRFKSTLLRFGDQSLFVKHELFLKAGGFDEDLMVMEDQEMVRSLKQRTSFRLLDQHVVTSARKYEENGVYKLQFVFTLILILYYFGAQQDTLVHLYKSLIQFGR